MKLQVWDEEEAEQQDRVLLLCKSPTYTSHRIYNEMLLGTSSFVVHYIREHLVHTVVRWVFGLYQGLQASQKNCFSNQNSCDKEKVCATILFWGLPEAPNSSSITYISTTMNLLRHKIHEAEQFVLQIEPIATPSFLLTSFKLADLQFARKWATAAHLKVIHVVFKIQRGSPRIMEGVQGASILISHFRRNSLTQSHCNHNNFTNVVGS